MGLFNKLKDILFDEVEVEETKEKPKEDKKEIKSEAKIAEKIEPLRNAEPAVKVSKEQTRNANTINNYDSMSERDLFKSDNTFPFPDFDEEEFSLANRREKKSSSNVLEYEKKKKTEKKYDFGRYERVETREVVEKKKFKPSPIISPVYGILNEDYKIEDIKDKTEVNSGNIDFKSVRKKAFGEIEKLDESPSETYYEETVTVKLKENEEEKKQKVKTIDELLEDTSDIVIDAKDDSNSVEEYDNLDADLEELVEPNKEKVAKEKLDEDDTLENDLFDLIDSMYDNREDGDL